MIEVISIISNGVVVVAIGALYHKINSQEKDLTDHIVTFTKAITNRPDFHELDKRIEKAESRFCSKLKPIRDDVHETQEKLFEHLLEAK